LFSAPANEKESIMKMNKTILATLAAGAALVSATAFADNGRHDERGGRHDDRGYWNHYRHDYGYRYAPRPVFVAPPPVMYAPPVVYAPPRVVYPAPVYYQAPRYYQPAPVYVPAPVQSGVSISFRLPLH
jgi:hypothetical protein